MQYPQLALLIDGQWLSGEGRATVPVINPATEEVLGHLPLATKADLDRALAAAERAWPVWRAKISSFFMLCSQPTSSVTVTL